MSPPTAPGAPVTPDRDVAIAGAPWLPPRRDVELPGLGTTSVRDSGGPDGAPVVLLLHGWAVTADLNFFTVYPSLAERYRVHYSPDPATHAAFLASPAAQSGGGAAKRSCSGCSLKGSDKQARTTSTSLKSPAWAARMADSAIQLRST